MRRTFLICSLLLLAFSITQAQGDGFATRAERYIRQYKALAMAEQRRVGIPAAITLAQGIHETSAGASELATEANNHFGIKCKKSWTGATYYHDDDQPDECFRKYESPEESYRDHSDYLKSNPRYAGLFQQSITDYAAWAFELRKAGYATNPAYAQRLIKTIEDYKLQQYTYAAMGGTSPDEAIAGEVVPEHDAATPPVEAPPAPLASASAPLDDDKRNGLRGFYARRGDVLLEAAIRHRIRYARLLEINDLPDAPLAADMFIYLEPKRDRGISAAHTVRAGETLHSISQDEGVRLRALASYNNLNADAVPEEGTVLRLVSLSGATARVRNEDGDTPPPASSPTPPPPASADASANEALEMPVEPREQRARTEESATSASDMDASAAPPSPVRDGVTSSEGVQAEAGGEVAPEDEEERTRREAVRARLEATREAGAGSAADKREQAAEAAIAESPASTPAPTAPTTDDRATTSAEAPEGAVNIANETAVEEGIGTTDASETPATPQSDPADPMTRLKSRFDDAIYSPSKKPAASAPKSSTATTTAPAASATAAAPAPKSSPATAAAGKVYYTVRKGDTVFGIARTHGITVKQLQELNDIPFDKGIQAGQRLRVK